jgi:uncharacterized membrane protein
MARHLLTGPWAVKRAFPPAALKSIEETIRNNESHHQGEIRFVVETNLGLSALLRDQTARERALEVFSKLRVWDTVHNNGVLIYLLLADRDVEILADRGIHQRVGQEGWEALCRQMETYFAQGRFLDGTMVGIKTVSAHLGRLYPKQGSNPNELPDTPIVM